MSDVGDRYTFKTSFLVFRTAPFQWVNQPHPSWNPFLEYYYLFKQKYYNIQFCCWGLRGQTHYLSDNRFRSLKSWQHNAIIQIRPNIRFTLLYDLKNPTGHHLIIKYYVNRYWQYKKFKHINTNILYKFRQVHSNIVLEMFNLNKLN